MRILRGHKDMVRSLAYSSDGTLLASGGADRSVKLWDPSTGAAETIFRGGPTYVHRVAFSGNGTWLAWGSGSTVHVYSVKTRTMLGEYATDEGTITDLSLTPDGRFLAAVSLVFVGGEGVPWETQCWQLPGGDERTDLWDRLSPVANPRSGAWSLAFAPDGKALARGTAPAGLHLFDWPSGKERLNVQQSVGIRQVVFTPDASRLLTVIRSKVLTLWDLSQPAKGHPLRGHGKYVRCAAFSPDGATVASGGHDGLVIFWDVAAQKEKARYDWQLGTVYTLAYAPDGMTLAVGGEKGLLICDVEGG